MTSNIKTYDQRETNHPIPTEKENIMIQPNITQQCVKQAVRATAIVVALALYALSTSAQTAKDVKGATPLVAIQNEAPRN